MIPILTGLQYAPPVALFALGLHTGGILLEKHEHFQKRTWRNKTGVQHPEGIFYLTIPLKKGKHAGIPVTQLEIAYDENWVQTHIRSFQTLYGKSAYFEEIMDMLIAHFNKRHTHLWDFNSELLHELISLSRINFSISETTEFQKLYNDPGSDYRKGISPGRVNDLTDNFPFYPQIQRIDKSFLPNLSILDVLFHLGPATQAYLMRCSHNLK